MQLANETNTVVYYSISDGTSGDCGQIEVDGVVDLPYYDNKTNVQVSFLPVPGPAFSIDCGATTTGEQVEILVTAE